MSDSDSDSDCDNDCDCDSDCDSECDSVSDTDCKQWMASRDTINFLIRHYKNKHSNEYSKYVDEEKSNLIEGLKLIYQEGRSSNIDNATPSAQALAASYAISNLIAKNSKSFCEGNFIKECLIAAVKSFGNSLTLEEATSIPLTDKTIKSRIDNIASSLEQKLKSLLESCSFFSLCLDESTDNRHVSQLNIFARIVQNDFSHVEALLDFVPLHNRTTGIDIFTAVNQTLQKFGIDFSKCSAIVTDGAKAMIGSKNGFFGQLKQRNLKFPVIHCIIHQEALCGKDVKLCTAMQTVTKITNVIKGGNKFLSHRKFQHFLEEHNAVYTDVPLHCEVRWLSAGKCLEKFFAIRKEIFLFLQEQLPIKYNEFKFFFEDLDSLCELAVITDVTNHLNILNHPLKASFSRILFGIDQRKHSDRDLKLLIEELAKTYNTSIEQSDIVRDVAIQANDKLRQYNKLYYDKHHKKPTVYHEGDYVLVRDAQKKVGQNNKLKPNYKGPYVIAKCLDKNRYVVKDISGFNITQRPYNTILSPDKFKPWIKPPSDEKYTDTNN
ncbi:protein FAM200A-like [Linepithema humile]|uniref:protein FAM200A-like n=1 Tax=Linepithema humile TaxID=83485 RepID=UPI00351E9A80